MWLSAVKEKARDLQVAKVPTSVLLHALADAVAQYLANATGGRVDIAMHGLIVISRVPKGASLQGKKV